jgi:hypothetical protein
VEVRQASRMLEWDVSKRVLSGWDGKMCAGSVGGFVSVKQRLG